MWYTKNLFLEKYNKKTVLIIFARGVDTLSGEATLSKFDCLLKKGSTLKGKNLLPFGAKFFPFRVDPFFRRGLVSKKANRKSTKLFPMLKMAENLPESPYC